MVLIDQKTKKIMEGCKERARDKGLQFEDETLEYIVTNRDLIELSPKLMIPTLYDYWVHDVEVLKEKGRYELYPSNPYETVINTRPAISFYNDNNPDWLNVMIFYHVLGHIDFFQNNSYYKNTWDYDFNGQALSDKRLFAKLRSEHGRWVDYIIEFSRGIDNIVAYHHELGQNRETLKSQKISLIDYYFDIFLQSVRKVSTHEYLKELERYNSIAKDNREQIDQIFFAEVKLKHPEFESMYLKYKEHHEPAPTDLLDFLIKQSAFLKKEENRWMISILEVIRKTSLFFQPQIRTKIMNEGWASYWHEKLFLADDRISGHEIEFARVNAGVVSLPRVGLNPYALGMRLFQYIEELGDTGKRSLQYKMLQSIYERKKFDTQKGNGQNLIFKIRQNYSDYLFIETFCDQDFVDKNNLFVAGRRLNQQRMVWEYYVKSRDAEKYKIMLNDNLYHPPFITISVNEDDHNTLFLKHNFEGKPLVRDFIENTLMGIEYLWGNPVKLETHEVASMRPIPESPDSSRDEELDITWKRVVYTMKDRHLSKKNLN